MKKAPPLKMLTAVVMRNPADLVPLVGNPNAMSDADLLALKASLRAHGLLENLVVQAGTSVVVGGNHRLLAIQSMIADGEISSATLVPCGEFAFTEPQLKKAAVALNRIGGEMGAAALQTFLADVDFSLDEDVLSVGLDRGELDLLLESAWGAEDVFGRVVEAPSGKKVVLRDDEGPGEPPAEPVTRLCDVWVMGEHRLVCGDSTNPEAARQATPDGAALLLTSPPYHVGKEYEKDQSWQDFMTLLRDVFTLWCEEVSAGGYAFVNFAQVTSHPMAMSEVYRELFVDSLGWQWHAHRVWQRPASLPFYATATPRAIGELEYLHTYRKAGGGKEIVRDLKTSMWGVWKTGSPEKTEHSAAFSVELPTMAINIYTDNGDTVAEPFCGTGTTIIACEELGRKCGACERDPRWVDVAVLRWQKLTNKQATLEATGETFDALKAAR